MEPLAILFAFEANREHARSALPDAPVVPPEPPRPKRIEPIRRSVATGLHHLADLVEPRVAIAGHPAIR